MKLVPANNNLPFDSAAVRWMWLVGICLVLSMAAGLIAAWRRVPGFDEAVFANPAYNLAKHGFFGTTLLDPVASNLPGINQRTYWVMPGYLLLEALWYKVVPSSIFWSRCLTILMIPIAGLSAFVFVRRLTGNVAIGALTTACLLLSYDFLYVSSSARPDLLCCVLGLSGMAVYMELRERHLYAAVVTANLLVCLAGLVHPNGILHFAGLTVIMWALDRGRLGVRHIMIALAPYLVLGAAYGAYISQDPASFVGQMKSNGLNNDRFASTWNPLALVWIEIRERYFGAFGLLGWLRGQGGALSSGLHNSLVGFKSVILAAWFLSGAALFWRPMRIQPGVRLLGILCAVYFAIQTFFNQKLSIYLIHIEVFWTALVAALAIALFHRARRRWSVSAGVGVLLAIQIVGFAISYRGRSYRSDRAAAMSFLRGVSANAREIVGSSSLWFSLDFETRLRDDWRLGITRSDWPDIIVVDQFYQELFAEAASKDPPFYRAIKTRLTQYQLSYDSGVYRIYRRMAASYHP